MSRPVPITFLSIPFGLCGLATAWVYAGRRGLAPGAIGDVLTALAALVFLAVLVTYARSAAARGGGAAVRHDLVDPIAGPFAALAPIVALVLVVDGVVPHAPDLGRVLVDVLVVVIVVLGGWYTGQWIYGPLDFAKLHPGYFLPTVAGGLIAAIAAGSVGQQRLGELLLGLGLVCWVILGSMILARLLFGAPLPAPLTPLLAIEVAPAAVASQATFAVHGERIDAFVAGLAGYGLLMAIAQVRLYPAFRALSFGPTFWAFTFSWAAVATVGMHWLAIDRPDGWKVYAYLLLAAVTALVGAIAARTATALAAGRFVPAAAPVPAPRPAAASAPGAP